MIAKRKELEAMDWKELQENAKIVRVSAAGLREAHPHDVTITKDAPNYTSNSI